jgi:type II secretory pathway component GspD/PulD (secretin)
VLDDGEVSLALATVFQDILSVPRESFEDGFVDLPRTSRRSYNGVVRCKLNETLVIGGLLATRNEHQHTGIPFLSRIPVVGWPLRRPEEPREAQRAGHRRHPSRDQGPAALAPMPMENAKLTGEAR